MDRSPVPSASVTRSAVTFKARRRGLSATRQAELSGWLDCWGLAEVGPLLDWPDEFPECASGVVLDIGFGHGEATHQMATGEPTVGIVGVEIHTPGVANLLERVAADGVRNVRVVHGDALVFLDRVPTDSLAGVRVFFPDPWPKVRQHHRRLVDADVVAALTDRLVVGGALHFATDIADYADQMQRVAGAEPRLTGGVIERPVNRPPTRFERRGAQEGRPSVDLWYERVR